MRSVPFKIVNVHAGFAEAHGAAYVEDEHLVLELQTTIMGMVKQEPQRFVLDLTDLESVEHKRGLFGDRLTLRTRPFDLIAGVPGAGEGKLHLRFARKHRDLLDRLLDRLDLWIVE